MGEGCGVNQGKSSSSVSVSSITASFFFPAEDRKVFSLFILTFLLSKWRTVSEHRQAVEVHLNHSRPYSPFRFS